MITTNDPIKFHKINLSINNDTTEEIEFILKLINSKQSGKNESKLLRLLNIDNIIWVLSSGIAKKATILLYSWTHGLKTLLKDMCQCNKININKWSFREINNNKYNENEEDND